MMRDTSTTALKAENLTKVYKRDGKAFRALDGVSLSVENGESIAIVGESGAGKSTLARILIKATEPTDGLLFHKGNDITHLRAKERKGFWKDVQMITQDPSVAFNPKKRVHQILSEPLKNYGICEKTKWPHRMKELLLSVELDESFLDRTPSQMSGGEQQRLSLARALAVEPSCLILDEATSALDMTLQEQLIELLADLRKSKNLTYVFIHHDLGVAQMLAEQIIVMKNGRIVETFESARLGSVSEPYVTQLVEAMFSLKEPRGSMFTR